MECTCVYNGTSKYICIKRYGVALILQKRLTSILHLSLQADELTDEQIAGIFVTIRVLCITC